MRQADFADTPRRRPGDRHGLTLKQVHELLDLPYEYVLPISSTGGVADNLPGRVA